MAPLFLITAQLWVSESQPHNRSNPSALDELAARAPATISQHKQVEGGKLIEAEVRNLGEVPLICDRLVLTFGCQVSTVLEHGWQSWSTVRPTPVGDLRPERSEAPWWLRSQLCADPDQPGQSVIADTVLISEQLVLGSLSARWNLVTFMTNGEVLEAHLHLDDQVLEAGETLGFDPLWCYEGDPGIGYSRYAALAGAHNEARTSAPAPLGWCSWYQYFGELHANDVQDNLDLARAHGLQTIVVDDGWQPEIGVWDRTAPEFGVELGDLAQAVTAKGMTAGIWTAPFLALEGGSLALEHPDWLVRAADGSPAVALVHDGWGGTLYALDTTHPEVLEHLEGSFARLASLGFSSFKVDFCYAAGIAGRRHGTGQMTRAEALYQGLAAIRAGIGEDAFLLGCGCPLLSAVGIVDAMRVSEDVAPHWEGRGGAVGFEESTVGVVNAITQSALRAPLHRRWFLNDPDCLLLRPTDTELTALERRVHGATVLGTGGYLVVSDDLGRYGDEEWALLDELTRHRSLFNDTLDLLDPFATPLVVKAPQARLTLDWTEPTATISLPSGDVVFRS